MVDGRCVFSRRAVRGKKIHFVSPCREPAMAVSTFNILMYSHDTYGLGHIRRTLAIAASLVAEDVNIIILTGSPIAGRFKFPLGIDFVRVPGMIKQSNTVYIPHAIKVNAEQVMAIRSDIITATAKAFDPGLFIVDKVPTGLRGEIMPTLEWFQKERPKAKVVLGLRDILDDAESTREEWAERDYVEVMDKFFSEIWVYGDKQLYNPISEYAMPDKLSSKTIFTGYLRRRTFNPSKNGKNQNKCKSILVTTGGGGDGYKMLDAYLSMLEAFPDFPHKSHIVSGPFIPRDQLKQLVKRAKALKVNFATFNKRLEQKMAGSDLVISMGGYNTLCEILSQGKVSLIIPRVKPRREQLIRAQVFKDRGVIDYLESRDMSPPVLRAKIDALLDNPGPIQAAIRDFPMTGLEAIKSRLAEYKAGVLS